MTATPDTEIQIDEMIDAVVASIAAAFPDLNVEAYREDRRDLVLPACLVRLVDMEPQPSDDMGTGQLVALARFEAHTIVGFRSPSVMRQSPRVAAAVARHLFQQRFGQPVGPAEVTLIEPDEFSPELDRFEVWRVEWQNLIHLGASVWTNDGTIPSHVFVTFAPEDGRNDPELWFLIESRWSADGLWWDDLAWGHVAYQLVDGFDGGAP